MSKKNNKKNNKKNFKNNMQNTPAKAEGTKKEESKVPTKKEVAALNRAKRKAEKKAKEEKKYAASKARIEARKARKKSIMDKLLDCKKSASPMQNKLTLEQRKEKQEKQRELSYNRHIASIKRRCNRMKLDEGTTNAVIDAAKKQWDAAKEYNITMVFVEGSREKLLKFIKDRKNDIKLPCITTSTAFLNNVSKEIVDELRVAMPEATIYQYRVDGKSPFDDVLPFAPKKKSKKKGGEPHSRECSKSRNKNFYAWRKERKAKKLELLAAKEAAKTDAKPVNKKPTQVKDIKSKSNKKAAQEEYK